ncbi:MAG: helix-turn-helix domain-containing protein [Wenzhouxiangellaceae bacterium]
MQQTTAIHMLESLASGIRLDIYRLLVKHISAGLVAGDIAQQLELPATNLSFHLKNMTQAGLLSVTQQGRYQRYRANLPQMLALIGYLTEECCGGEASTCLDFSSLMYCAGQQCDTPAQTISET